MTKYRRGYVIPGIVTGVENYGIFVGFDENYSGLIHISEISNDFVKNINDVARVGETIYVKIIDVDEDNCHVKLSIRGIDYKPYKKGRQKINETELGFLPLKEHLDDWITSKLQEIEKN